MDIRHSRLMLFPRTYSIVLVRRNETICCLIGFGIGVGCCILYRILKNLLNPAAAIAASKRDVSNKTDIPGLIRLVSCLSLEEN